ncbi:MAG: glycosyltransferase family 4 protein [Pyrinomonadaceae bacterium]|nr:glycosyltransferase family 4 protein [Pyrinomonadaceae bacterium]
MTKMEQSAFWITIATAYISTIIGVELWRRMALRRQLLDVPNERSSHTVPTPRGGGAVIAVITIVFFAFGAFKFDKLYDVAPFLIGASLIAIVGGLDDLYDLSSILRLAVQIFASIIIIFGIGYFDEIQFLFGSVTLTGVLGQLLSIMWVIGLTNTHNFMDGIDGIAGSQSLIAGIGWCLVGFWFGMPLTILLGGLLAATSLGFLWHNWFPARIFMGDVGSAFLGFCFASIPFIAGRELITEKRWAVIAFLLVWTFAIDTSITFVRRILRGENVLKAHRSHFYQKLVISGYAHSTVTLWYGLSAIVGVIAVFALVYQTK